VAGGQSVAELYLKATKNKTGRLWQYAMLQYQFEEYSGHEEADEDVQK
jgi:hypothetical protein